MSGLTRSDIDDILRLIDASDFDELKLEIGDTRIELVDMRIAAKIKKTAAAVQAPVVASGGGSEVPAPLLGTFYHAPKPGADPFVKPGDRVTAETVIGIIEVMKLMNSVEAGIAGTVVEFVAPNGELVEHGQTLIRIQPD